MKNHKTRIIYIELIEHREAIMKKLNKFFALCLSLFCIFGMITPISAEGEGSTGSNFTELEKHDPDAPAEFMALKAWTDEGNGLVAIPRVEGTDENVYEYNLKLGIKQPISFNWWGTLADGAGANRLQHFKDSGLFSIDEDESVLSKDGKSGTTLYGWEYYATTPIKTGTFTYEIMEGITLKLDISGESGSTTTTFTDVNEKTDHKEDIDWLVEKGITKGFPDGTYRPYSEITRCDMAAFLRRFAAASGKTDAATWTPSEEDWNRFSDVSKGTDHAEDILWLAHTKITFGFKDGSFKPYANITRCDMAAFLNRIYNKIQYDADIQENINNVLVRPASDMPITNFTDVDTKTDHYFDIQCIAAMNITTGYPDGSFRPYDSVVRCDMAAFLHRTFDNFY